MNQDDNPFVTKSSFSTRGIWKQFERRWWR
jgi:hypothetical protein